MAEYIYSEYEAYIWKELLPYFNNNAYAVAGAMGWMYGESYLVPYTCENDTRYSGLVASAAITARFDKLGINETGQFSGWYNGSWISDSLYLQYWRYNGKRYGPGYGLAQWTETQANSRKTAMMNYWKSLYRAGFRISIGSANFQCKWFKVEMTQSYPSVFNNMVRATSVREAMTAYGYYEAENSPSLIATIVNQRVQFGINLYNKYSGSTPIDPDDPKPPVPPDPVDPTPGEPDTRTMSLWMLIDYDR